MLKKVKNGLQMNLTINGLQLKIRTDSGTSQKLLPMIPTPMMETVDSPTTSLAQFSQEPHEIESCK